jgi:hypothetical protein
MSILLPLNLADNGQIVERSSASLRGRNSRSMGVDKDHSGLAKFDNMLDPAMQKFIILINDLLNHSKSSLYFGENRQHGMSTCAVTTH